jgi:hypothetical protein
MKYQQEKQPPMKDFPSLVEGNVLIPNLVGIHRESIHNRINFRASHNEITGRKAAACEGFSLTS